MLTPTRRLSTERGHILTEGHSGCEEAPQKTSPEGRGITSAASPCWDPCRHRGDPRGDRFQRAGVGGRELQAVLDPTGQWDSWGHAFLLLFPWTLVLPIPAGHPQRPEGEARAPAETGSGCPRQKGNKCLSPSGGWLGCVAGGGHVKGQPGRQACENSYTG